jgi:hypothetical protein
MKPSLIVLISVHLWISVVKIPAADVLVTAQDFTGQPATVRRVTLQPTAAQGATTNSLIVRSARTLTTDTAGQATFTNTIEGWYSLTISGSPASTWTLYVPATNASLNAHALAVDATVSGVRSQGPWILRNAGYATNSSLFNPRLAPGSGVAEYVWTLTNAATGAGEWRTPGAAVTDTNGINAATATNIADVRAKAALVASNYPAMIAAKTSLVDVRAFVSTNQPEDLIVQNSITAQSYQGDGSDLTGVAKPSDLTLIPPSTNAVNALALAQSQSVVSTNYQAGTNQAGVIAADVAAHRTNFPSIGITSRTEWPGKFYIGHETWAGSGVDVLIFYDIGGDGAAFWITNNALAADDARFASVTLGGVTHTTWPSGSSINTNAAIAFTDLGATVFNFGSATGVNLTMNALYDSSGSTGAVGQLFTKVTSGGYAWSNVTSIVSGGTNGVVTVRNYGATGDGTTDDRAAFVAALAASSNVVVEAGTYRLSAPLILTNGQSLFGLGNPSIYMDLSVTGAMISSAVDIGLHNLTLDGRQLLDYGTIVTESNRIGAQIGYGSRLMNVRAVGWSGNAVDLIDTSLDLARSSGTVIANFTSVSNWCGIISQDEYITVNGGEISRGRYGVRCAAGNNSYTALRIVDCFIGFNANGSVNNGHGNFVGGFLNHCGYPILVENLTLGFNFTGNQIMGAGSIFFDTSTGVMLNGNQIALDNIYARGGGTNYLWNNWHYTKPATNFAYVGSASTVQFWNNTLLGVGDLGYGNSVDGTISGNGSGLTNLNTTTVSNGIVTWTRGLFDGAGVSYYVTTNIAVGFTNADVAGGSNFAYNTTSPFPGLRSHTAPANGTYFGSVTTTNRFLQLNAGAVANSYLSSSNGSGTAGPLVKAELYISYNGTNWFGDWSGPSFSITESQTNMYSSLFPNPSYTSTNASGFFVQRRYKMITQTTPTAADVHLMLGTNHDSHISLSGATVDSGNVYAAANNTFTGTNTFISASGIGVWSYTAQSLAASSGTNWTLLSTVGDTFIDGAGGVALTAFMGYSTARVDYWTLCVTNLGGANKAISFGATTNAWKWSYGQTAPSVLTNGTQLLIQARQVGSNILAAAAYYPCP